MSGQRKGLRTEELMERIYEVLETHEELSYDEIIEIDKFDDIPDWKLELALKKLLYTGEIAETESNNYRLDSRSTL
ncbi:hypothetical protein BDK61_3638 [Haloarcula quadrata]|uniref:Uncharacterized protein n=1 Tax=Haloarcula quadrata TaxID=182779 RepID=A0A495QV25_9EURY|nr:hypothetical protein BDK61_3638 [Haloarcula quadrata]